MTKKNKWILISSILVFVVIAVTAILIVLLNNNDGKWTPAGEKEYTPPSDPPHIPVITHDIIVGKGLKSEYYLNETFDISDIYIHFRTFVDGALDDAKSVMCTPLFVKGYPEVELPDTDTLGEQRFTLTYLSYDCEVSFDVVPYNEKYALRFINENVYMGNDSLFVKVSNSQGQAKTFVDDIYSKVVQSGSFIGPLVYLRNVDDFINIFSSGAELDGVYGNPDNTNESATFTHVGNQYNGTMWVTTEGGVNKIVFELEYYPDTKGIRLEMDVNDVDYGIYISSTETSYNMVVSGADTKDIVMTYNADKLYLATADANSYTNIFANEYSDTFGSMEDTVLEYNMETNEYQLK